MLLPRDTKIVTKLAKLCLSNTIELRCRHVAALVDKNRIVSIGMNKAKTDAAFFAYSQNQRKMYCHAEADCLKGMPEDCSRLTLYVVRVDRNGAWAQSKPCPICADIIKTHSIGRVIHTVSKGLAEQ